jgi:hypothetical protein
MFNQKAAMIISDIAATLTGERMMIKCTGDQERPSRDEIARLADHFYETWGRQDGRDVDDWLSAERELTHHYRSRELAGAASSPASNSQQSFAPSQVGASLGHTGWTLGNIEIGHHGKGHRS